MPAEIFADGDQDYIEKFNTVAQQAFDGDAAAGRLDDHIDGTADKHGASAIVNTPAGGIAATDVQAAINELDTEKQPKDATLTAFAALTIAADKLPYGNGSDTFGTTDLTSAGRALLDDADASAQRTTLGLGTAATLASDTDTTLAANSDTRLATQKAIKAYVDALIAASDAVVFRGATDCSANPNYPAADAGHLYIVSVAGKIGGASGVTVEAGDMFICKLDSTASGDQATVGANWSVIQTNINGAVVGPSSAVDSRVAMFDGTTGKLIKDSGLTLSGTNTGDQTSVTGNAGTATALQTPRAINGTNFDGTAAITVTAAAGTLTGATLASGVTASSLTSVGTLTSLAVAGATSMTANSAGPTLTLVNNGAGLALQAATINVTAGKAYQVNAANAIRAVTGDFNWFFGPSGNLTLTGQHNTIVGAGGFASPTTANDNSGLGVGVLHDLTTGAYNVALGSDVLYAATTGSNNVGTGVNALRNLTTGGSNVAIGTMSLSTLVSGDYNVSVGTNSLRTATGTGNTVMGDDAAYALTTGQYNAGFGKDALRFATTSSGNAAFGRGALYDVTTGGNNTAVGSSSGGGITTGTGNTIVGANVGGLSAALSNNIILANGTGAIKAQHDGTDWTLTGGLIASGAFAATTLNIGNAPNGNGRAWALNGFGHINGAAGNGIEWRNSTTGNITYITNQASDELRVDLTGSMTAFMNGTLVTKVTNAAAFEITGPTSVTANSASSALTVTQNGAGPAITANKTITVSQSANGFNVGVEIIGTGDSGAILSFQGNGVVTPNGYQRRYNGGWQWLNSAISAASMELSDAGALNVGVSYYIDNSLFALKAGGAVNVYGGTSGFVIYDYTGGTPIAGFTAGQTSITGIQTITANSASDGLTIAQSGAGAALAVTSGQSTFPAGTAAAPSVRVGSTQDGMFAISDGSLGFGANGVQGLRLDVGASAVNGIFMYANTTGNWPMIRTIGSDSNVGLAASSQGNAPLEFFTNSGATQQMRISHTASALNFFSVTGSASGGFSNILESIGSDANIQNLYATKGTYPHVFRTNGSSGPTQFSVIDAANAVNYAQIAGAATGGNVTLTIAGSDSNRGMSIVTAGTGTVRFNNKIHPGTPAAAAQTATGLSGGTGAPSNTDGSDGDFYFRSDGGALTSIYQKRAGVWVGII